MFLSDDFEGTVGLMRPQFRQPYGTCKEIRELQACRVDMLRCHNGNKGVCFLVTILTSSTRDEGLQDWCQFLEDARKAMLAGRDAAQSLMTTQKGAS